jgi:hypothetical protein
MLTARLAMNFPFVAAEVTRRIFFDHNNLRLLTSAATVYGGNARSSPRRILALFLAFVCASSTVAAATMQRLPYNHPGLAVDLGVGLYAFPMPMDWDGDGDLDLVVACPDKHYNGVYLFENPSGKGVKMPVFKAAKRLGPAKEYMTLSTVNGKSRVLAGNLEYPNFTRGNTTNSAAIYPKDRVAPIKYLRGNTWRLADLDGDGAHDLLIGHDSWDDFGWFGTEWWRNYSPSGEWTGSLTHGWVYWVKNEGTDAAPKFGDARPLFAALKQMEVLGAPSPNLADFDGDGDLDVICGEFVDGFTYFQNVGTRKDPKYAIGVRLTSGGKPLTMDLQMIVPHAIDWDADGDVDLICGDEDGRVAFIENTGKAPFGVPEFLPPRYFQQEADHVKCGALATPAPCDWDGDGDEDIISGDSAGYLRFIENLSGKGVASPKWAAPRILEADGKVIRIQAGTNGSIQGPIEAKWGYTAPSVADWDGDGLLDLVVNSIWGRIEWYRNIGTRTAPKLGAAQSVEVEWPGATPKPEWNWWNPRGKELITQWRTSPVTVDWDRDGLMDLILMDHEGWLCFWPRAKRDGRLVLLPGRRVLCDEKGEPLRFNGNRSGASGRRKLAVVDWDGDGRLDILADGRNAMLWRQVDQKDDKWLFKNEGDLASDDTSGHSPTPSTVDWDGDGIRDLLVGAQEGHFYFLKNPRAAR